MSRIRSSIAAGAHGRRIAAVACAACVACARSKGAERDSASAGAGVAASVSPAPSAAAAAPAESIAAPATIHARAPSARPPTHCTPTMLNVVIRRPDATNDSTLRAIADEILSSDRRSVTGVDISPAIRAFRVHLADTASADRVMRHIRAAPGVEDVSPDDCSMRRQRARP